MQMVVIEIGKHHHNDNAQHCILRLILHKKVRCSEAVAGVCIACRKNHNKAYAHKQQNQKKESQIHTRAG